MKEMKQIVFVSDFYSDQVSGGAELSIEAVATYLPKTDYTITKLQSSQVNTNTIEKHKDSFWIFGNYTQLNTEAFQAIINHCRYVVFEYDYKFCKHRLPQLHQYHNEPSCNCNNTPLGNAIFAFLYSAQEIYFMSEEQKAVYLQNFPHLIDRPIRVTNSTFTSATLNTIRNLNLAKTLTPPHTRKALILESKSWLKATDSSRQYCENQNIPYELVSNLNHEEFLEKLTEFTDIVYLPRGWDTCPRMIIEARLLGLNVVTNSFVQHESEDWAKDPQKILEHLQQEREYIIQSIHKHSHQNYTISSYFTTRNCIRQEYPFEHSIRSAMLYSDEIVVVDSQSDDGTLEALRDLQKDFETKPGRRFVIHTSDAYGVSEEISSKTALLDGQQKALARSLCTSDFLWQMDVDEIVHEDDAEKIKELAKNFPKAPMMCLPVIEYWGSYERVRMDIMPWKWRMSYRSPRITHGVPIDLRTADGSLHGTDGCDPIDAETGLRIQCVTFWSNEAATARHYALMGNPQAQASYASWFSKVSFSLPGVHHLSWIDIKRKIRLYRSYWSKHWDALYGVTKPTNHFFDKPWSEVTDEDIEVLSQRLATETGGHIFHEKWSGNPTPYIDPQIYGLPNPPACLGYERKNNGDVKNDW